MAAGASDGAVSELGPVFSVSFTDPDGRALKVQRYNPDWTPGGNVEVMDEEHMDRLYAQESPTAGAPVPWSGPNTFAPSRSRQSSRPVRERCPVTAGMRAVHRGS